jgi:hypothetical protein
MIHSFDSEVAEKLGVNAAIIVANLAYLQTQRAIQGGDEYYFEGRWWVRHSYQTLSEWHPYFSVPQIKRVMKPLIEAGHVVTRQPNHFNRTTYWSVAPEFLHGTESDDARYEIAGSEGTESYDVLHDNEHITNGRSPTKRFKPPTVAKVAEYCKERGNGVDANRFIDFYESKGWMVGKNKMKCWKAAVRNWERNNKAEATSDKAVYL